ncbi:hypothetical protein ZANY_47 [Gordonia phage Zany]|uniref:Uncharacterized protein n=1 Tax=Gordonia phage Zany TaxID=2910759 RepID=A0AA49BNN9_9CAUD|nr:hypothetical protein ZANY_47 [Gordonia phage Zany]
MPIPEQFEECRIYGHAWRTYAIGLHRGWIEEELECMRCSTKKVSNLQRKTGLVLKVRYIYPANYVQKGEKFGRLERGALRVRHIKARSN